MQLLQWSQNHSANHVETLSYWNGTKLCWTNRASTLLLGESEAVDKHSYWMILSKRNGRIKWRYTAASKTGQSCSNIQLPNEDEASLNQLGNDTSCYGGDRSWISSKKT
ncbi:unnamed protein product [Microthlaspi erraticum]|uniref:Uncharacterized protein n=1 Tax=Microthlaspi erraticum TaxID=1685480 RepID=A0A6D2KAL7_9BRAS|nr:unnamed protein product [Microthlaspi erraticum]